MSSTTFRKHAAIRIALVSILLAAIASPVSWFIELEATEQGTVSIAMEESRRILRNSDAVILSGANAAKNATVAAQIIAGGLFDIAEIYNRNGTKLAESMTDVGKEVEKLLPPHLAPKYKESSYQNINMDDGRWLLRVFIPLHNTATTASGGITGYFEGVRVVPDWQRQHMLDGSLRVALMVCLASVLCGLALYPVVVHLASENDRKARDLLDSYVSMMEALGRAIAKRDSDTGAHNYRVAWIATRIAEKMGLDGAHMQALIAGSFLHDVGKIGIPDAILLKPGKLNDHEFSIMRSHVQQGEDIVAGMGWLDGASSVVAGHHEKWNGSGYPRQLSGDEINFEARIFAVADVFDALCSKRPYKEAMSYDDAMTILNRDSGTHFDPAVMDAFRPMARAIFDRLEGSSEEEVRALLMERVRRHFRLTKSG
jgi:HD-GYP domain-containing protein (c-di-GMP phosphodiesterase class II)